MSLVDILGQFLGGAATDSQLHQAASELSPSALGPGLAEAFRSQQTPPIGEMVGQLFGNSNPAQQAGMLNQVLAALGPMAAAGLAGGVLSRVLPAGATQVTPAQAQQLSPDDVQQLVNHAHQVEPGIADRLGGFYAQHSGLIRALGSAALSVALVHVKDSQRQA